MTNIILSTTKKSDPALPKNVFFAADPHSAIKIAKEQGQDQLLLIGGGTINGVFLKENLINEIILTIHPLVLGKGIKLFENIEKQVTLEKISSENMDEGLVKVIYKVC